MSNYDFVEIKDYHSLGEKHIELSVINSEVEIELNSVETLNFEYFFNKFDCSVCSLLDKWLEIIFAQSVRHSNGIEF